MACFGGLLNLWFWKNKYFIQRRKMKTLKAVVDRSFGKLVLAEVWDEFLKELNGSFMKLRNVEGRVSEKEKLKEAISV
jgi:hypothetical protein